jgi:O-antigen/teichoic acid export membrane protein
MEPRRVRDSFDGGQVSTPAFRLNFFRKDIAALPLRRNIIANYSGQVWTSLMGLVFVPLNIKFMGVESWGLVGVYASLWAIFFALDFGLGAALDRQTARLSATPGNEQRLRDLIRTMEVVYGVLGVITAAGVLALSRYISSYWIRPEELTRERVETALAIIAASLAFRWPCALYAAGLRGLQRQVAFNWVLAVSSTLRGAGSVMVQWLVSPTVEMFLIWRAAADAAQAIASGVLLWRALPPAERRARFRKEAIRELRRFSVGAAATGLLFTAMTQMDKIALSRLLSLEMFGYYSFAWIAAETLFGLVYPVTMALSPRLAQLAVKRDNQALATLYHQAAQLISVVVGASTATLAFFSWEAIAAWAGPGSLCEHAAPLLSLLALGTGLCAILRLPHAAQLAHGWTWLGAVANAGSLVLGLPLLLWLTGRLGATGGALVWPLVNAFQLATVIPLMHQRILKGEQARWYVSDLAAPIFAAWIAAGAMRLLFVGASSRFEAGLSVALVMCLSLTAAGLAGSETRRWIRELARRLYGAA